MSHDEAIRIIESTRRLYPDNIDFLTLLAHCQVMQGKYTEALATIGQAQALYQRQELTALRGFTYARMGETAKAREALKELLGQQSSRPYLQPYFVAWVYVALGENQKALDWLEKAADDRTEHLFVADWGGLRMDPAWDTLQNEPRYWKLCDSLGMGKDQWPRRDVLLTPPP